MPCKIAFVITSGFLVLTAFRQTDKTSDEGAPILNFEPASISAFSCLSKLTKIMINFERGTADAGQIKSTNLAVVD